MKLIVSILFIAIVLSKAGSAYAQAPATSAKMGADSVNLKVYTGSYTLTSGSPIQKFTVTADKGDLFGEADSYGKNKLIKQAKPDTYQSTSSYGSIITFVRDGTTKAVTGLTLATQGTELSAKKDNP
ncbi:DUF3471 domain-containing protein [Spirosoma aureum]|uniref:DUF3471 domain-containing protein n=1 Tax=Spirosoma aureum TaxID=2692134 RepID=A0A6G9ANJ9_9BACT|nr:DUF3471 domain-containing protein [Spirosoma aureum]QIP14051.1 DUF3471 domain-containing protein [Spirosoma aureum]